MKLWTSIIALFFLACSSNRYSTVKEDDFLLLDSLVFKNEVSKFKLTDGDTLVDIGSGYGINDKLIFRFYPRMYFILEDINKRFLKKSSYFIYVNNEKHYFKDHSITILGKPDSIPLKTGLYKNILCRITLHEFTNPTKMLSEIKRIMTDNGKLIIVEAIPEFEGEVDKACKKKLLSKGETIHLLSSNGFKLLSEDSTQYTDNRFDGNAYILMFGK